MLERPLKYQLAAAGAVVLLASVSAEALAAPVVDKRASSPVSIVTREELEKLPVGRSVIDLLKTCPATTIPTVSPRPRDVPADALDPSPRCVQPADIRMIDVYRLHNAERAQFNYQPLRWNVSLEASASAYAQQLARTGQLVHSSRKGRGIERENLSQGLPGWRPGQLMRNWLAEKANFVPGLFPNVSRTGNWYHVSHYSQMIWPTTTDLGCGIAAGGGYSWLVCRYSPGGNKDGKPVGQQ